MSLNLGESSCTGTGTPSVCMAILHQKQLVRMPLNYWFILMTSLQQTVSLGIYLWGNAGEGSFQLKTSQESVF
uniref:Uncharacterized protein n=1 Tax=Arundo donax TaxID=35708 RepID=A0A0A9G4V1_ARUDO